MSDQGGARRPALRAEQRPSYRPEKPAGLDPDLRQAGLLAACAAAVLALVAGTVSLVGGRQHGVPVIEAEPGPIKIKPADPGGMKASGSDFATGGNGQTALAPTAEQPEIAALQAQVRQMNKQMAQQKQETARAEKIAETARAEKIAEKAADMAGSRRVIASPLPTRASATAQVPAIPPILRAPSARPIAQREVIAPPQTGVRVQLAAFTDAPAAHAEWESLARKMPDLLGGRSAEISRAQVSGRIMWRLRTGPFADLAQATGFCASLRARGADCSIAAF